MNLEVFENKLKTITDLVVKEVEVQKERERIKCQLDPDDDGFNLDFESADKLLKNLILFYQKKYNFPKF